jgi:hypothetical protein
MRRRRALSPSDCQRVGREPAVGRENIHGGVAALGSDRVQFDFEYEGVRYRPTLKRNPSEANLKRARRQLSEIKERIVSRHLRGSGAPIAPGTLPSAGIS